MLPKRKDNANIYKHKWGNESFHSPFLPSFIFSVNTLQVSLDEGSLKQSNKHKHEGIQRGVISDKLKPPQGFNVQRHKPSK